MAQNVTTAFVDLFESEVKQAYQAESVLRGTTRTRTGVQGNTVKFPKIGKGVATLRVAQTDVTPLNVTYGSVTASMTDYIAAEYSDIFHQSHINFDERRELVHVDGELDLPQRVESGAHPESTGRPDPGLAHPDPPCVAGKRGRLRPSPG